MEESENLDMQLQCICGGTLVTTTDDDGNPASLLHSMPMCKEYEMLEPDEFLRWLRTKIEGTHDA